MGWERAQQVSAGQGVRQSPVRRASHPRVQQAPSQAVALQAGSRAAFLGRRFLQEEVRELSKGWMSLTVEKACWGWFSFLAVPIPGVKVSPRPALRADPPSAFYPLPAAVLRVISFRPA